MRREGPEGRPARLVRRSTDGVAATKTEAQEHKAAQAGSKKKEHGKSATKKGHGKKK